MQMVLSDNLLNATKEDIFLFAKNFNDDVNLLSGWGHNYFCEVDGGRLKFDLEKPQEHICSSCGKVYTSEKYNKTWVYLYRYRAIEISYKAAVLYRDNRDEKLLDVVLKILTFYADNYEGFEKHAKDKINPIENGVTGFGKIMPQGLNEAMMLINIVHTLILVRDYFDSDQQKKFSRFVDRVTTFLYDQRGQYHNIICWIDSAIGCAGIYLEREDYIESATKSKYGLENQLENGLTEDGFWYEGSVHYHFFTAEGILNFLLVAEQNGMEFPKIKKLIRNMLTVPYYLSFNSMVFPNPNDGWPEINIKTYSHLYYMAYKIYRDEEIDYIVYKIDTSPIKRTPLPLSEPFSIGEYSVNQILFPRKTVEFENEYNNNKTEHYEKSGFSILKSSNFNLFMKYAHKHRGHAHPDLLNIEFTVNDVLMSRDLSNPGYGSDLYDKWYGKTLSHNTVVIGGEDQSYTEDYKILKQSENAISVELNDVYKGATIGREISLADNNMLDKISIKLQEENHMDYILHMDADLETQLDLTEDSLHYIVNGYQYLMDVKKYQTEEESVILRWSRDGVTFSTDIDLQDKELFLCRSFDNPSSKTRNTIVLRTFGKEMQTEISFSVI